MLEAEIIEERIECLKIAKEFATDWAMLKENYAELIDLLGVPKNE